MNPVTAVVLIHGKGLRKIDWNKDDLINSISAVSGLSLERSCSGKVNTVFSSGPPFAPL